MAHKKSAKTSGAGGCLVQILLGFLAAIAAVLAVLFFLSSAPLDADPEGPSIADEAAARAQAADVPPAAPAAAPAGRDDTDHIPPPTDGGLDPRSDDQIADDAAAAGMTSRPPSPAPE